MPSFLLNLSSDFGLSMGGGLGGESSNPGGVKAGLGAKQTLSYQLATTVSHDVERIQFFFIFSLFYKR